MWHGKLLPQAPQLSGSGLTSELISSSVRVSSNALAYVISGELRLMVVMRVADVPINAAKSEWPIRSAKRTPRALFCCTFCIALFGNSEWQNVWWVFRSPLTMHFSRMDSSHLPGDWRDVDIYGWFPFFKIRYLCYAVVLYKWSATNSLRS